MYVKRAYDVVTLQAAAVKTITGNGDAVRLPGGNVNAFVFTLDVTAAATESGDKLDVYIQTKADGANWVDVQHFTQVLGNGGTKRFMVKIAAATALAEFEVASALGAGTKRDLLGDDWRSRWVVVDAGADNASFTFSLTAIPM